MMVGLSRIFENKEKKTEKTATRVLSIGGMGHTKTIQRPMA